MSDEAAKSGAVTDGQLDITGIANEDLDALAAQIEKFYKLDGTVKTRLSYNWDRNHKFLDGNQWIVFDGNQETGGVWRKLTVSKANEYIPRPVTNLIFDGYQTLKSYLIKNKPRSSVRPNTQTYRDKSAARIADLILETNWERLQEPANYEQAAACLITYGTVFKKSYWDTSSANMVKVPRMEQRPKMDPQTGAMIGMEEVASVDPATGDVLFDELPLGDVNTDIVEPYRIALDPLANDLHKARWIMEYSIQPVAWIQEVYGKDPMSAPGYTGRAEEVGPESGLSGSMKRFSQLKTSSGVKNQSSLEGATGNSGDYQLGNSAVVKEYYERPSIKHPKGRLVVVANSIPLYAGDSPTQGPEQGDWHPYSECRWELVPGRFWGKSPLDAGVEIQKQINSIDSVIILTRKTMAIPQKLVPTSAGIPPGTWTGRPGQQINYRESGSPPSIIPAHGVDVTVFKEREQRAEDLKNVMGAIDILKGDRPPGVTAASALNLLYEVGTGKLFPVLERWKRFVESDQKKQLKVVSKGYKEPRPDFIRMMMGKNTELSPEAINKFIGTDLYDNCNVVVEAGSNVPKLQAAKQAALEQVAALGVLDLTDPQNRVEYLDQMGIKGFDGDISPDKKRAEWENDMLDNIDHSADNQPVMLYVDNDEIHMSVLEKRMKEPSFLSASQAVQQAYMAHYQEHMQQKSQKDTQNMMESMANGQPPGESQANASTQPHPLQPHGSGPPEQVKNALKSDLHVPGGSQ